MTNVTPAILSKLQRRLHAQKGHPLNTLRTLIESSYPGYSTLSYFSPVVTVHQNFDELSFPKDHPGRSATDSYYINKDTMLRTHTSAHEVEVFREGEVQWLLTADVYRRDEIDCTHYPIFHQMEGAHVFDADANGMKEIQEQNEHMTRTLAYANIAIEAVPHASLSNPTQSVHDPKQSALITEHLKLSLNMLILRLFGDTAKSDIKNLLRVRWIEAHFPFTCPSFEVEVFFQGKWLEILGCGVIRQATLDAAGVPNKIGWAFGLGLERIAMILYSVPDIRFFWSDDPRFLSQFKEGKISTFRPYSKFPPCFKDISFWTSKDRSMHENDFFDLVRDVAGELVEDVRKIDNFVHQKSGRTSLCFRINYRSTDRSLSNMEVKDIQYNIISRLQQEFGVEVR